ncbi:MAG: glycosyltransferase family 25 protein [Alphaproteobacteria bacterium]|nr:glycosyltransferase family 25 protein [Alphaproteobacteria bacterium]
MRVILISLARAPERRQKMTARFQELGVPFEILEATDGQKLTEADLALVDHEGRKRITPYPLSNNEIGCCISHCRAMQIIRDSGERMGVIIEDDAALSPDFPRVLQAIENLAAPFDIIDLHRTFKKKETFVICRPLLPGFALGRIGYSHINAQGYVITREGAEKFLSVMPPFNHMVDKEMHRTWANGINLYGLETPVVFHADEGHSYLDETRSHDKPKERKRYPDADRLYWKWQRFLTRSYDSIFKRITFPAYVRQGKGS